MLIRNAQVSPPRSGANKSRIPISSNPHEKIKQACDSPRQTKHNVAKCKHQVSHLPNDAGRAFSGRWSLKKHVCSQLAFSLLKSCCCNKQDGEWQNKKEQGRRGSPNGNKASWIMTFSQQFWITVPKDWQGHHLSRLQEIPCFLRFLFAIICLLDTHKHTHTHAHQVCVTITTAPKPLPDVPSSHNDWVRTCIVS